MPVWQPFLRALRKLAGRRIACTLKLTKLGLRLWEEVAFLARLLADFRLFRRRNPSDTGNAEVMAGKGAGTAHGGRRNGLARHRISL